jgi:hypothetical protein
MVFPFEMVHDRNAAEIEERRKDLAVIAVGPKPQDFTMKHGRCCKSPAVCGPLLSAHRLVGHLRRWLRKKSGKPASIDVVRGADLMKMLLGDFPTFMGNNIALLSSFQSHSAPLLLVASINLHKRVAKIRLPGKGGL